MPPIDPDPDPTTTTITGFTYHLTPEEIRSDALTAAAHLHSGAGTPGYVSPETVIVTARRFEDYIRSGR